MKTPTKSGSGSKQPNGYREFTRGKFQKYQKRMPHLAEGQIAQMIVLQWARLTEDQKNSYKDNQIYQNLRSKSKSKSKSKHHNQTKAKSQYELSSQNADDDKSIIEEQSDQNEEKMTPEVRQFFPKRRLQNFYSDKRLNENQQAQQKNWLDDQSEMNSDFFVKRKRDQMNHEFRPAKKTSQKHNDYINFYKFYYRRLQSEHKDWSGNQITKIISLLWKNRMLKGKNIKKDKNNKFKQMSGRKAYLKSKQFEGWSKKQAINNWKKLPFQSKKYWGIVGKGGRDQPIRVEKNHFKFMRTKQHNQQQANKLAWMDNTVAK